MLLRSSLLPATKIGCLVAAIASSFQGTVRYRHCDSAPAGGSLYLLGVWAGQIKKLLGLTQTQTNAIATTLFFGGCVATPLTNHQPWSLALLFGILGSGGYMIFWAACKGLIDACTAFVPLLIGSALIGNNIMTLFIMALVTALTHLDSSSKQLYQAVMQGFFAVGNICWPLIAWLIDSNKDSLSAYLSTLFLVLAVSTVVLVLVCMLLLHPAASTVLSARQALVNQPATVELTNWEMLKRTFTLEFSAVVALYFVGLGLTANVLSNANSMIISAQGPMSRPPNPYILMVEFGLAQATGRVICIAWNSIHKTPALPYVPLVLAFLLLVVAFTSAVLTSPLLIRLVFLLTGVCYGLVWSSFSAVVMKLVKFIATEAEEKAMTSFGIAVSYVVSPAFGPLLFSLLSGFIYDSWGTRTSPSADISCYGKNCYHLTFIFSLMLSGAGLIGASALHWKDRKRRCST